LCRLTYCWPRKRCELKKLGKYEVLGELGHGAMGVVYRARDPIINRPVALKIITASGTNYPDLLQRFYREAQSAGGLQHPNIVTIYDMGDQGGVPYIAMELIEGKNLEQLIASRATLPISLKLVYAMQACAAFDYAHKRGIIHRDIKPGNVMLTKEGTVKVVDFGIARVLEASKTQTGMLIGTFAYMSPEQYHGEHADERSDIWSFGVLLYELLCYERPFSGSTAATLMHNICVQEPRLVREVAQDCPPELEAVVSKLLQKSPVDRCQSMEDLLIELGPICKSLQGASVTEMVAQSRELVQQGDFSQARDVLRQALQFDSTNPQVRSLLERVNAELKRLLIRPKAQERLEKGRALLEQGKIQEAKAAVESALELDSSFEAAQELQRLVQKELHREELVCEWLQASKQRLAEGVPDEAEVLLLKVLEAEPSNEEAKALQSQVLNEKAERQRRLHLLQTMQQARNLWTQQNYAECTKLLIELQKEYPDEDEISRLLETVREDEAEQEKLEKLEKARNLLASREFEECSVVLADLQRRFPSNDEISRLLVELSADQAKQRRLQSLAEARRLLAARGYEECFSALMALQKEFPGEDEISGLLQSAREDQAEQLRQQGVAKARNLLVCQHYQECSALLTDLRMQYPKDDEIPKLLAAVLQEQAEQRRSQGLVQARSLLASRQYDECISLLATLQREFPDEAEILKVLKTARAEQAEQRRLRGLAEARNLIASRRYDESIAVLAELQKEFSGEKEIAKMLETAGQDRAEQQKQQRLAEARALLASQHFQDALRVLDVLSATHAKDAGVLKLRMLVQREQEKQVRSQRIQSELAILKKLVSEKKYSEVLSLAEPLRGEFPHEPDLARLVEFARSQQARIERELLLQKTLERTKAHLSADRFEDAVRAAQAGQRDFPENSELVHLCEQAQIQEKKHKTRQQIEQRIREIKIRINRAQFSDAIDLAKRTLVTLGPDTDVTQLLNSAQVEFEARERKRKQETNLGTIRSLVESGRFEDATRSLKEALENELFEPFDPRAQRASLEIEAAKTAATTPLTPGGAPSIPSDLIKEYMFQQGPPSLGAPAPADKGLSKGAPAPHQKAEGAPGHKADEEAVHTPEAARAEWREAGRIGEPLQFAKTEAAAERELEETESQESRWIEAKSHQQEISEQQEEQRFRAEQLRQAQEVAPAHESQAPIASGSAEIYSRPDVQSPLARESPAPATASRPLHDTEDRIASPATTGFIPPFPGLEGKSVRNKMVLAVGAVLLAVAAFATWNVTRKTTSPPLLALQVTTSPPRASVHVKDTNQECVTPHCILRLPSGHYDLEVRLQDYETVTQSISVSPSAHNAISIQMEHLRVERATSAVTPPEQPAPERPARLDISHAAPGAEVFLDGKLKGKVDRRATFSMQVPPGDHRVKILAAGHESSILMRHFSPGGAVVLNGDDFGFSAPTQPVEQTKPEDLYWALAHEKDTVAALRDYLNRYPNGKYAQSAQVELARLDWQSVQDTNDNAVLEDFLRRYPSGDYHDQAVSRLDDLVWHRAARGNDLGSLNNYLERFPNGRHADEAGRKIDQLRPAAATPTPPTPPETTKPREIASSTEPPRVSDRVMNDKAAIIALLRQYQKAYEDRSIEEFRKIWPSMTESQIHNVDEFFKSVSSVKLAYGIVGEPEIKGDEATVMFTQSINFAQGNNRMKMKPAKITMKVKKVASAQGTEESWQINSIR